MASRNSQAQPPPSGAGGATKPAATQYQQAPRSSQQPAASQYQQAPVANAAAAAAAKNRPHSLTIDRKITYTFIIFEIVVKTKKQKQKTRNLVGVG